MSGFDSATLITGLPNNPGVYRMLDANGTVLYVGKARDLKKRVSSYFSKHDHGPRIGLMIAQIAAVEITPTRSEGEALILENNLIKSLAPKFNILFRDDKSYPYLIVTKEDFPRVAFYRGALERTHHYFGPYPNAWAVRSSIQLLQKVFRLRTCEDTVFQNRSRPCLLYQIKRCSGPCVNLVDRAVYADDVANAMLFLNGREDDVLATLGGKMEAAAVTLEFEKAAMYRDQIRSLSRIQERQYVDTAKALDADAVAVARGGGMTCVNLAMVRNGRYLGDKSFFPEHAEEHTSEAVVLAFLEQHYAEAPLPAIVILNENLAGDELRELLTEQARRALSFVVRPQGERRVWLDMAEKNAAVALAQRLRERGTQEDRIAILRATFGLPETAHRIECFDVSHTQGEATVASCVVYDRLGMRTSEYRRFNISGITPGDDYAAMKQALERRYEKLSHGNGVMPDLVLIDGGHGQIGVARAVFAELGLSDIPLIGVAKGPQRRAGMETLIIADADRALQLAPDSPALHLIQQIRDEAHRFAITGHRARRAKVRVTSSLEDIPGIGVRRRKQLLTRFGGLRGVQSASIDDLSKVDGISRKLAETIYNRLH